MLQYRFALAAVIVAATLFPARAQAVRLNVPILYQVTNNTVGDIQEPNLRLEPPQRITFISDGDVLGPGTAPAGREIFEYDYETDTVTQLTDSAPGESFDPARPTDITQTSRGEFTAFVSTGDLDPSIGNADGNAEIFIRLYDTGEIRQVTDTPLGVVNSDPYPSDSGRCLVYSSTGDMNDNNGTWDSQNPVPVGGPFANPDGSEEVFLLQMDKDLFPEAGSFTQLSNGPAGTNSSKPVIGGFYYPRQCNSTFYISDAIQAHIPGDHTFGTHVYEYVRDNGTGYVLAAREINRPNNYPPSGDYFTPAMSSASNFARGPFAVFTSNADIWNNENDHPNVFRFRSFHPRMTQYTGLDALTGEVRAPVISDGGRWIAFESNANLNRKINNSSAVPIYADDGNFEIWRMQKTRKIQQITDTPAGCENTQVSLNDAGLNMAFRSTCDLIPGRNPGNVPQVFFYMQVKQSDPLACVDPAIPCTCDLAAGCCNEANGCYHKIDAKAFKSNKKNCAAKGKCL